MRSWKNQGEWSRQHHSLAAVRHHSMRKRESRRRRSRTRLRKRNGDSKKYRKLQRETRNTSQSEMMFDEREKGYHRFHWYARGERGTGIKAMNSFGIYTRSVYVHFGNVSATMDATFWSTSRLDRVNRNSVNRPENYENPFVDAG